MDKLKKLFQAGGVSTELVYISSCSSEPSGKAFEEAGVPHVVAVKMQGIITGDAGAPGSWKSAIVGHDASVNVQYEWYHSSKRQSMGDCWDVIGSSAIRGRGKPNKDATSGYDTHGQVGKLYVPGGLISSASWHSGMRIRGHRGCHPVQHRQVFWIFMLRRTHRSVEEDAKLTEDASYTNTSRARSCRTVKFVASKRYHP